MYRSTPLITCLDITYFSGIKYFFHLSRILMHTIFLCTYFRVYYKSTFFLLSQGVRYMRSRPVHVHVHICAYHTLEKKSHKKRSSQPTDPFPWQACNRDQNNFYWGLIETSFVWWLHELGKCPMENDVCPRLLVCYTIVRDTCSRYVNWTIGTLDGKIYTVNSRIKAAA